ncbi:MAG: transposase [Magnetococcales bacterium]|nr:transposase [Magnetococcales bacterium]
MLFEGTCNSIVVNSWVEKMLFPELEQPRVVVTDNASFHSKRVIHSILEKLGHILLPLPPYSPDLNPIEESFVIIKKSRLSSIPSGSVEEAIMFNYD